MSATLDPAVPAVDEQSTAHPAQLTAPSALATQATPAPVSRASGSFSLVPTSFEEGYRFARIMAASDLVPKDFRGKPENCFIAVQMGLEVGLSPMAAVQNIAVVNGRPALWGDAVLALVRGSKFFESIAESVMGNGDDLEATCTVKRRGEQPVTRTFSMRDAKLAGLAGKEGTWRQYPKRMLQMRARAFALRDVFPDVLKGIAIGEEVADIVDAAATVDVPRSAPVDAVPTVEQFVSSLAPEEAADALNVITGAKLTPAQWKIAARKHAGKPADLLAELRGVQTATVTHTADLRIPTTQATEATPAPAPVASVTTSTITTTQAAAASAPRVDPPASAAPAASPTKPGPRPVPRSSVTADAQGVLL